MSSLVSFMEQQTARNLKNISSNQYIVATLESGDIRSSIPYSRRIGVLTFGLSTFFTKPYVSVEGPRTTRNVACLKRLQAGLDCVVVDNLVERDVGEPNE